MRRDRGKGKRTGEKRHPAKGGHHDDREKKQVTIPKGVTVIGEQAFKKKIRKNS